MIRPDVNLPRGFAALLMAATLLAATGARGAESATLRPHTVRYQIQYKNLDAGELELSLRAAATPGQFLYETRPFPSFLAGFLVKAGSRERSTFAVTATGVRPLHYHLDDSTQSTDKDAELDYDWARRRVTGTAQGHAVDLPLTPGFQDVMSIRMAVPVDLLAGRKPGTYVMLDGREAKSYVFENRGTQRIRTALGEFDTVVYLSRRATGGRRARTWTYWYSPAHGYLPVRIEQREADGTPRLTFRLRGLAWSDAAAAEPGSPAG